MWANRNFHTLKDQGLAEAPEQGSQEWLEGRKGRITGSKSGDLFFNFKKEEDWDVILDKWFGDTVEDFNDVAKSRMAWGSKHEDTAVTVILDSIPGSHFFECPQINIDEVYAVSPDGAIIVLNDDKTPLWWNNCEIKAPGGGVGKTPEEMKAMLLKKWKLPASYYSVQILQEMVGQNASETLFVAWTPLLTRMWRIKFDQDFWNVALDVLESFRLKSVPFEVMQSKINKMKRMCWGIMNVPIFQDVETSFNQETEECVVKKIKKY